MSADQVAACASEHGYTVAFAESLTGGTLASALAATEGSSDWFAGGVVAYQSRTKQQVLGVSPDCPVISAECVSTMADTLADLMSADAVVTLSGVGGPEEQEGNPPGTAWIATLVRGSAHAERRHFPGSPEEVLEQAREAALELLLDAMRHRA